MKVNHCFTIDVAVADHEAAIRKYEHLLGLKPTELAPETLPAGIRCTFFTVWNLPDRGMIFNLLSAADPSHPINQHIASRGEGVYQVGFEVDRLEPFIAQAQSAGVGFIDDTPLAYDYGRLVYCNPDTTHGVPLHFVSHNEGWWAKVQRGGR